jgi:hypothetical protein
MVRAAFLLLIPVFFMVSCQKGDTGPAGATGAAGAAGAAGPQGPAGSANVIYSGWFTPAAYTKDTVFDLYNFYYNDSTTDITQQVIDSGLVITFGDLAGYNTAIWPIGQVEQLPITVSYKFSTAGITYNDTWSAQITAGSLRINFADDQNYYSGISNAHEFRYVIIPGGRKSTVESVKPGVYYSNGKKLDQSAVQNVVHNYKQMSYAQVCEGLGISQ